MNTEEIIYQELVNFLSDGARKGHEKVWLSIRGNMGSEDVVGGGRGEYYTEGDYYFDQNTPCISYHESAMVGMGNTNTTIKLEDDQVSVIRLGDINSLIEFKVGKQSYSFYETPYGQLMLQIYTKAADVDFDENRTPRKVFVEYELMVGGQGSDTHSVQIEIRPKQQEMIS